MRKRRGHGEGSIFKHPDGRWEAQLDLGTVAGRRQRKSFSASTQKEVVAKLNAAANAARHGVPSPPESQTFATFAEKWIIATAPTLRESTAKRYGELLRHAVRSLGRTRLVKLQPADLQRLYEERRRQGAAPRSVLHLHRVISRALRDAERWGETARNVARLVDPPRVARVEVQTLNGAQARDLLRVADGDRLAALLVLALATGMRQGELLGLTWRNVDLETGMVRVQASLQRSGTALVLMEPKTSRSRRQIDIEPRVVAALRLHRKAQIKDRLAVGAGWQDLDLVFCNRIGGPIDGRELLRSWFRPMLVRAGLPRVRFHDLRHSYASIALSLGVHPKVVQEAMGHSTIAVTLDLYSHTVPTLQRAAAREMGEALFGS